ncbi:MAG: alpha-amylase, partial [Treponema sp.]|nr:alpha-amylase [Treponema sp.]
MSEALSVHGDGRYFTLFREQRSGLWFIRSSKEISEKGLYVSLKGYEAQVFLDIHEVADDSKGRWAKLNHELEGRGVPDPGAAVQDLCLGELYYRFTELLKPEVVEGFRRFFTGTAPAGAEAFITSLREPVLAFIETAKQFIGGADGRYDPFVRKGRERALPAERTADQWGAFLARLLDLAAYSSSAEPAGEGLAAPYLKGLAAEMRDRPFVIAAALGYGILSLLRPVLGEGVSGAEAARLGFDHWSLDRKLREQYRGMGIPEAEGRRAADLIKAVLSRTVPADLKPYGAGKPAGRLAAAIIEAHYDAEDFRSLLGINFFEDVTWFNKEGFEDALFYGSLFFTLENEAALAEYSGKKKKVPV